MRAVIYCRVSSHEQLKNLSLETQTQACVEFCRVTGLEVAEIFVERGESARSQDRTELQRMLSFCRKRKGHVLGFGIGLAQGYATMGTIGFGERLEYTAIGAVVNLAARLCADAADGQILTNSRLAAAIGDTVEIDELGERTLRGMSRPVAVVNLRALRS